MKLSKTALLCALASVSSTAAFVVFQPHQLQQHSGTISTRRSVSLFGSVKPLAKEGDWGAYLDDDTTGLVYYFNKKTGESLWEPPTKSFPTVFLSKGDRAVSQEKQKEYRANNNDNKSEEKESSAASTFFANLLNGKEEQKEIVAQVEEVVAVKEEPKKDQWFDGLFDLDNNTNNKAEKKKPKVTEPVVVAEKVKEEPKVVVVAKEPVVEDDAEEEEAATARPNIFNMFSTPKVAADVVEEPVIAEKKEPKKIEEPVVVEEEEEEDAGRLNVFTMFSTDTTVEEPAVIEKKKPEPKKVEPKKAEPKPKPTVVAKKEEPAKEEKAKPAGAGFFSFLNNNNGASTAAVVADKIETAPVVEDKTIQIDMSSYVLPHPAKVSWGGEDAVFTKGRNFGVFDGVSGADKLDGVPLYSNTLAKELKSAVGDDPMTIKDMTKYLTDAAEFADISATGASTAVVGSLNEDGKLSVLNLGDSACVVVRGEKIVAKTTEINHFFDCPYQLSDESPDRPRDGRQLNTRVQKGDVIVMGSDGIFDNLTESQIVEAVNGSSEGASLLARKIVNLSRKISLDETAPTPYAKLAKRNGFEDYESGLGGKVDDASCVVVRCK